MSSNRVVLEEESIMSGSSSILTSCVSEPLGRPVSGRRFLRRYL